MLAIDRSHPGHVDKPIRIIHSATKTVKMQTRFEKLDMKAKRGTTSRTMPKTYVHVEFWRCLLYNS